MILDKFEWLRAADDRALKRFSTEWMTFDCQVKNYPNVIVQLRQGDKLPGIQRIADGRKLKNNGNVFNLTNITYSDEGMYYCVACRKSKKVCGIRIRTGTF